MKAPIRILYICKDFTNWIGHGHLAFKKALARVANVTFFHKSCYVPDLLKRLADEEGKSFDVLMLGEAPPVTPPLTGLAEVSLPKVVHYWDVHVMHQRRLLFIRENKIDLVVVKYKEGTRKFFPQLLQTVPCAWLPIGVDTSTFKNWSKKKSINILLTGSLTPNVYPLRVKYLNTFKHFPGFVHIPHPGYAHFERGTALVGDDYARLLNSARVCPTCGSVYGYVIQKYYEIPASFSLLAAPHIPDLTELGFVPDVHFLNISATNFESKIKAILKDEERLKELTLNGAHLVRRKHSVLVRAKQFVNLIVKRLLNSSPPFKGLQEFWL